MVFGVFKKVFKKRSTSQPVQNKNDTKKLDNKKSTSYPNLKNIQNEASELTHKSLGQINPDLDDDDDDRTTNPSSTLKTKNLTSTGKSSSTNGLESTRKSTAGYESSSESSDGKKSKSSLDFLNTLTGTNQLTNRSNLKNTKIDENSESITSISSQIISVQVPVTVPVPPQIDKKQSNRPQTLADRIKENQLNKSKNSTQDYNNKTGSTTNQSVTFREPESDIITSSDKKNKNLKVKSNVNNNNNNNKKNDEVLLKENLKLKEKIVSLEKDALDREAKFKKENDALIIKLHDNLSKNMIAETDKQELIRVLVSKQQESNERLINEQEKIIQNLNFKCKRLENEIKMFREENETDLVRIQFKNLSDENEKIKDLVKRLSIELNFFYEKYGRFKQNDLNAKIKEELEENKWKASVKQLSPLFVLYDEKLLEKDETLKLMKIKINDLTSKFNAILEENADLHSQLDNLPDNLKNKLIQITSQAELVLEENKFLNEQLNQEEKKLFNIEKSKIQEISRLSKRLLVCETERIDLMNQIDMLKENNEEIFKKYNNASIEAQRRVKLDDHLTQISDLKRQLEEINLKHKQELENTILKLQASEDDKKSLITKYTSTEADLKRLKAENQVLEKALSEGIGRKTQRKLKELEKKIEKANLEEKIAISSLEKLSQETQKLRVDKEMYENLSIMNENELKERKQEIIDLNIRLVKLQENYDSFKNRASIKIAKILEKLKKKETQLYTIRVENEKKMNKVLKLIAKKQDRKNKIYDEQGEQENESKETSTFEQRKLKKILLELKTDHNDLINTSFSTHKD